MTKRFSSEFGIRFFLLHDAARCMPVLQAWTRDPDEHVRRLVSEGTRPRLPWAMQLPMFIADPSPALPLLEALRDDPSEYVRRSVANHLNDIAKDHPDLVAGLAARWLEGATPQRAKLVRHACRTLVKKGHPGALAALGHGRPAVRLDGIEVLTPQVHLGEALVFAVSLRSEADGDQELVVDYVIHHRKANGKTSPKVFKWKRLRLGAGEAHGAERRHPIRPITTRVYYGGEHIVELQVNGQPLGRAAFDLLT
jgi:3-methyladenine DNA glycosylase AlkC